MPCLQAGIGTQQKKNTENGERASFHSGDIGNINIDESGKGVLILIDQHNRWSIGGPAETNVIGRAVVVHQGRDDMVSQPSGAARKRTGCGPIIVTTGVTEK